MPVDTFDAADVAADLRSLVQRIEAIHPDPYRGYDGRVALHTALESTIRDLPDALTTEQCYRRVAELVAGLEDAHSRVAPPETTSESSDDQYPISFRVVGDHLYVDAVHDTSLEGLLGARLLAVEGDSLDSLLDRYTRLRGCENDSFARLAVGEKLAAGEWLGRLLGDDPGESLTLRLRDRDGTEREQSLRPVGPDSTSVDSIDTSLEVAGTGPRYRLRDDGQTAVFVPGNLSHYREAIQYARSQDAGRAEAAACEAYTAHHEGPVPDDAADLVASLPSMVETVIDLVTEMAEAATETLVVDLRDNSGGDSRYLWYLCYALYGWERLAETYDWGLAVKRRSPAHRERYGVPEKHSTHEDNPADYDFSQAFQAQALDAERRIETQKRRLADGRFADELAEGRHEGYYEPPQVVVATTAGTMSSAFAGAALLSQFGADVVGVPPGQAPHSFGEAVTVDLSNTGLSVDIAGALFRWTPTAEGPVLPMDRELTPEVFEGRYDCAGDAVLRLAVDQARGRLD